MREVIVKIEPFESMIIDTIHIEKKVGSHASAVVKGIIKNSDYEATLALLKKKEVWIQIKAIEDYQNEKIIYWGLMTGYEMEHKGDGKTLTLELMDGTILMEAEVHTRVFQNPEETYRDILDTINQAYPNYGVISTVDSRKKIEKLYVQYEETDWEFVCRIAAELHTFLVPDTYTGGVKYYVGLPRRKESQIPNELSHRIRQGKRTCHIIKCREVYEIGEWFVIAGAPMYIHEVLSNYINGELIHEYFLYAHNGYRIEPYVNEKIAGCSLMGTVKDVKMDMVKLQMEKDELSGQPLMWFPYSTIYSSPEGTGWYCMPEIGDSVRIHFPDADEEHGYVISAVHLEADTERSRPGHKSFKSKHNKQILFTPEKIEITNNKGTRIVLSDESGIIMQTDKSINLDAVGNILVTTKQGNLTMKSTQMIKLQQDDTVMKLDKDIILSGGELRIQ